MAYLYLLNRIPEGFRLRDIFAPTTGSVTYGSTDGLETARSTRKPKIQMMEYFMNEYFNFIFPMLWIDKYHGRFIIYLGMTRLTSGYSCI
ncbi:hypothetical protein LJD17_12985 [Microvirga rosea]|nr:hypothetical protein [Microvirga rosea]